jgi:hypothetical protein
MAVSLGEARGSITISTEGVIRAERVVKRASANMTRDFNALGKGVGGITDQFRKLDSVLGVSFGVGIAVGIGRTALELGKLSAQAELTEKSFDRLASGVGQSSDKLLESMRTASRGVISDANLILGANRAIGTGVADTAAELNQILEIARATGQAYGKTTTDAYNRIVEAVSKLEPELLDELGITVRLDQVFRAYAASLGTTADKLTDVQRKAAFLNEIIRQSKDEVAAAANAGDSAADKYLRLGVAWDEAGKAVGDFLNAAGAPILVSAITVRIKQEQALLEGYIDLLLGATRAVTGFVGAGSAAGSAGVPAWMTGVSPAASAPLGPAPDTAGRTQAKLNWAEGVSELNQRTNQEILETTRDYNRQRADTERDYQQGVAREARDFAINRQRQEQDLLDSLTDIRQDAARREADQAADLARSIAQARSGSAERIAEAREDANEQLLELEEDYQRARERAAEKHLDTLLSAAGRLDAVAVYEEQKRFARESKDAEEAHDEQRDELNKQLQERLDDEAKALEKSIRQQQEAYARQLEDARENDRLRIADMKADFAERKEQEDADRATRLADQAADHAAQLVEMDTARGERIAQIRTHAAEERTQLDEEANKELAALGVRNKAYDDLVTRREANWEKLWDKFMGHVEKSLTIPRSMPGGPVQAYAQGGYVPRDMLAYVHRGEYVVPASATSGRGGRSVTVGTLAPTIVIGDTGGRSDEYIKGLVVEGLTEALEQVAR